MQIVHHPYYLAQSSRWELYRQIMGDSIEFIEANIQAVGVNDNTLDYRKKTAYNPGHVSYGVTRIKNAIFDRMHQITRTGGSESYQNAVSGKGTGIDKCGNTMNHFISTNILLDLMVMGRVGVMVDNTTRTYMSDETPYIYSYRVEDIINWTYTGMELTTLLLKQCYPRIDKFGLTTGTEIRYMYLNKTPDGIVMTILNSSGAMISTQTVDIPEIPFVLIALPESIIDKVTRHQIAELNLSSMDLLFAMKANVPFYTEQVDGMLNFGDTKKDESVVIGVAKGRQYPKGLDRPDFINPSSEPLVASMAKQRQIAEDIDKLLDLAVSNLTASRVSEGTKKTEFRGLEGGLSAIGKILESAENTIARYWSLYDISEPAVVRYPESYQMDSEEQRLTNSEKTSDVVSRIDSPTLKREAAKYIADKIVGQHTDKTQMDKIKKEIDASANAIASVDTLYWSKDENSDKQTDVVGVGDKIDPSTK